jgi:RNA polymerase sigma factor (sigma-70 family)
VIGRHGASLDELEALYRSRFDVFARVAESVTGDSDRARDAVQGAFATAVRKRRSFRGDGPLEAWVWRIVLNAARWDVRRSSPAVEYDEPAGANGHPERDAGLRVALARLPERQRTAVFLRYYADLDYATIGDALGISTGTARPTSTSLAPTGAIGGTSRGRRETTASQRGRRTDARSPSTVIATAPGTSTS